MSSVPDRAQLAGRRLLVVLALFGAAYFLSLFFRTVNAILAPRLEAELGLDAAALGLLTAAYFLGLGLAQIPIGLCLDAYGPRRVQAVLLLLAAAGVGLFAGSEALAILITARALIGVGLAGCLMAAFHAANLWLSSDRVPLANGLFLAVGGLGVLAATMPFDLVLRQVPWRPVFGAIALGTALTALAILRMVPEPDTLRNEAWLDRVRGITTVFANRRFRRYLPVTALCFGTGSAMQGLWTAVWLRDVADYDGTAIAWSLTAMALALAIGSALGGTVSMIAERAGFHLRDVIRAGVVLVVLAEICVLVAPASRAIVFWVLLALSYNVVTLSYAHVARSLPVAFTGRSNTLMNTVVIMTTFVIQYGLGVFLAWGFDARPALAFTTAITALVVSQAVAFVWTFGGEEGGGG